MKKLEIKSLFKCGRPSRRMESKSINVNLWRGLSPHIVKVIFSKLPFSNLPVCRLVSKTWNCLVLEYASSPEFLPNAFLVSITDNVPNPTRSRFHCNPRMHCIAIDTMTSVASFGFDSDWSTVIIVSSCNGLLFVYKMAYDNFCPGILNPITSEFIQVPKPELEEDIHTYGFGFDPTKNQYKLFRFTPVTNFPTDSPVIMEVFRFGRSASNHNQWSHVVDLPFEICDHGTYLNGVIYWIGKELYKENEYRIYALDVETEKIELVRILEFELQSSPLNVIMESFNQCIYVAITTNTIPCKIKVWMLHGKDSCIGEFVIDDVPDDWVRQAFHLVKVFEDGRILFQARDELFCLDNNSGRKMKIETFNPNESQVSGFSHMESLHFGSLSLILAGGD